MGIPTELSVPYHAILPYPNMGIPTELSVPYHAIFPYPNMGILTTKSSSDHISDGGPNFSFLGNSGGIVILWDDNLVELDEIAINEQEIHATIKGVA
ncbi:hypothetical protein RDI58_021887 [Solanum bulbocastanum]|uniref:Uncharacterized protein n=1 Tax=Solanum bulbocastanum TaxID=147425 RepID=A0AAN8T132_SOLBU